MKEITVEVWGDFACFTPPYAKVERLSYPFPTPSEESFRQSTANRRSSTGRSEGLRF